MMKRVFPFLLPLFIVAAMPVSAISLVRVGYIDVDVLFETYTEKYLETEIARRESFVDELRIQYSDSTDSQERFDLQADMRRHNQVIYLLRQNRRYFETRGTLDDDTLFRIIQRDVMSAIRKTSELEGYSLVLDNSGNFVYGSDDINLTERVLFRLDELLLDLQEKEPSVPLSSELVPE
jgi:Skp family chaperone for outer membrane proteins